MALADITAPLPPARKGVAANSTNQNDAGGGATATPGLQTGSGGATSSSSSGGGGGPANSSGAGSAATNALKTNTTASFLSCQTGCQTSSATCIERPERSQDNPYRFFRFGETRTGLEFARTICVCRLFLRSVVLIDGLIVAANAVEQMLEFGEINLPARKHCSAQMGFDEIGANFQPHSSVRRQR